MPTLGLIMNEQKILQNFQTNLHPGCQPWNSNMGNLVLTDLRCKRGGGECTHRCMCLSWTLQLSSNVCHVAWKTVDAGGIQTWCIMIFMPTGKLDYPIPVKSCCAILVSPVYTWGVAKTRLGCDHVHCCSVVMKWYWNLVFDINVSFCQQRFYWKSKFNDKIGCASTSGSESSGRR